MRTPYSRSVCPAPSLWEGCPEHAAHTFRLVLCGLVGWLQDRAGNDAARLSQRSSCATDWPADLVGCVFPTIHASVGRRPVPREDSPSSSRIPGRSRRNTSGNTAGKCTGLKLGDRIGCLRLRGSLHKGGLIEAFRQSACPGPGGGNHIEDRCRTSNGLSGGAVRGAGFADLRGVSVGTTSQPGQSI